MRGFLRHGKFVYVAKIGGQCSIYVSHEQGDLSVDAAPKIFLQNKLNRCRSKLGELRTVLDAKRRPIFHIIPPFNNCAQKQNERWRN